MRSRGTAILEESEGLTFKESRKGKRKLFTVNDVSAFKMGNDSFLALQKYKLPLDETEHNRFAKVILQSVNGILCTFEASYVVSGFGLNAVYGQSTKYLVLRSGQFFPLTEGSFYTEMPLLVTDHIDLKHKITTRQFTFADVNKIAAEYEKRRQGSRGKSGR